MRWVRKNHGLAQTEPNLALARARTKLAAASCSRHVDEPGRREARSEAALTGACIHLASTLCVLGAELESEAARWLPLQDPPPPHHLGWEKTEIKPLRSSKRSEGDKTGKRRPLK